MNNKEKNEQREPSLFPEPFILKEKDKERERTYSACVKAKEEDEVDPERFYLFYNDTLDQAGSRIPRLSKLGRKRLEMLHARCKEYGKITVANVIIKAAQNPFLNGHNSLGWCANIDWLLAPNNFIKVLEGNYDSCHWKRRQQQENEAARRAAARAIEEQIHRELHESIRRREQNCVTYEEYQQALREGRVPAPPDLIQKRCT